MSLILHPSVHFVCIAQDTPLAENAHLTRLGGSFGKQAFRELIMGLQLHKDLGSSRTASANSQMKSKALTKAVLSERTKMPPYKEGLFVSTASAIRVLPLVWQEREEGKGD